MSEMTARRILTRECPTHGRLVIDPATQGDEFARCDELCSDENECGDRLGPVEEWIAPPSAGKGRMLSLAGQVVELCGKPFVWGKVVAIHRVGVYAIVEAVTDRPSFPVERPIGERFFHPYVDGRDSCRSFDSLDGALAFCIAWRAEDANFGASTAANSESVRFFERMIGGFVGSHKPAAAEASS